MKMSIKPTQYFLVNALVSNQLHQFHLHSITQYIKYYTNVLRVTIADDSAFHLTFIRGSNQHLEKTMGYYVSY